MSRSTMNHFIWVLVLTFASTFSEEVCKDLYPKNCKKWERSGFCHYDVFKPILLSKCRKSCSFCDERKCVDLVESSLCKGWLNMGLCEMGKVSAMCASTCKACNTQTYCPRLSIENGRFESEKGNDVKHNNLKVQTSGLIPSGTEVRVKCDRGYQLMGSESIKCLETGEYDGVFGVCLRHGLCDVPMYSIGTYFMLAETMSVDSSLSKVAPGTFGVLLCIEHDRKMETFCSSYGTWLPELQDCDDDTAEWQSLKEVDENSVEYRKRDVGSIKF